MADEQQDWRLQVEVDAAPELHAQLHGGEPLAPGVVLSYDADTLFAYAPTRDALDTARQAIGARLDGRPARFVISRWDDTLGDVGDWLSVDPPEPAAEVARERAEHEAAERVETRTVVVTSGRFVRSWFEGTVTDEAREQGVELEIVEHPHLLTTQVAFTLTGPTRKVDGVVADIRARAGQVTLLESNPLK
jgi:hypothetical protein